MTRLFKFLLSFSLLFAVLTLANSCKEACKEPIIDGYYKNIGLSLEQVDIPAKGGEVVITTQVPFDHFESIIKGAEPLQKITNGDVVRFDGGWFVIKPISDKKFSLFLRENKTNKERKAIIRVTKAFYVGKIYLQQEK